MFKGTTLMGRDMIGLVALDFVLGVIFRSVMDMALVVEVRRVDGDDGPCHAASFGIPAHMIAYLEFPSHLGTSPLSFQKHLLG